jgi:hypothetical protein
VKVALRRLRISSPEERGPQLSVMIAAPAIEMEKLPPSS